MFSILGRRKYVVKLTVIKQVVPKTEADEKKKELKVVKPSTNSQYSVPMQIKRWHIKRYSSPQLLAMVISYCVQKLKEAKIEVNPNEILVENISRF